MQPGFVPALLDRVLGREGVKRLDERQPREKPADPRTPCSRRVLLPDIEQKG